jgi:hypothetical protein
MPRSVNRLLLAISCLIFALVRFSAHSQTAFTGYPVNPVDPPGLSVMEKIDSISRSAGAAACFAKVYSQAMIHIAGQMKTMDPDIQFFIQRFESGFAEYFLSAVNDHVHSSLSTESEWSCFFSSPEAGPWQLVLLGVNAHVNINIWQTLVTNFSKREIRQYKKPLLAFQAAVAKVFYPFFDTVLTHSRYLRFLHFFSLGLDKKFGKHILYKWRRRNVKLALLYYTHPRKFERRRCRVYKKKNRIDKLILRAESI